MAIYPNTASSAACANTQSAVGEVIGVVHLEFATVADTIYAAAILWREAIACIPSLNDSLLGRKPLCASDLGIDLSYHKDVRRFFDQEGLENFWDYLVEAVQTTDHAKRAPLLVKGANGGFRYQTSTARAEIVLQPIKKGAKWSVSGWADFIDPRIAQMNLTRKGFKVHGYQTFKPKDGGPCAVETVAVCAEKNG